MTWFLRKAFRLGPFRFNLSKSGVGVSAGVTGARIGVDARGRAYVHAGRGGLYYRKRLTPAPGSSEEAPASIELQRGVAITAVVIVLLVLLGLQFQRAACAVLNIPLEIIYGHASCAPRAPAFGAYFWPIFAVAGLAGAAWIGWAARTDAETRAWLELQAHVGDRRPLTSRELRDAMEPRRPVGGERP
jgi:hypothetical protein